jgi:hypothetical protein
LHFTRLPARLSGTTKRFSQFGQLIAKDI